MDDFLREIQEDVDRQRWANLWKRYGTFFTVLLASIIFGAAGWQVAGHLKNSDNMKQTDAVLGAVRDSTLDSLSQAEGETADAHQAFAALIGAQLLTNEQKAVEADKKIEALASSGNSSVPADLAKALTGDADAAQIFTITAIERAGWKAIEAESYAKAQQLFETIIQSDEEVPASLYDRAKAGLAFAGSKQHAPTEEK